MSRSFLTLAQELARECRIPGTGPSTVISQTGELEKVVRYIKNADLDIKRRWADWGFLWNEFSTTTVVGSNSLTSEPSDVDTYNVNTFVLNASTDNYTALEYVDYSVFREKLLGSQTNDTPTLFTVKPDRSLAVWPPADAAHTLTGEYWKTGVTLAADDDTSEIPTQHDRLIVVRAKLYYAEAEDAPEIMASAVSEHEDLMRTFESRWLRDQQNHTMMRAETNPAIVAE